MHPHRSPSNLAVTIKSPFLKFVSINLARVLIYADEPTFNLRLGCSGYSPTQTIVFSVVDDTMVTTNTSFQVEVPPLYDPSIPTDQVILDMKHTYLGRGVTESVRHLFRTGRIAEASQIMNVLLCLAAKLHMNDSSIPTLRISSQNMLLLDIVAVRYPNPILCFLVKI